MRGRREAADRLLQLENELGLETQRKKGQSVYCWLLGQGETELAQKDTT